MKSGRLRHRAALEYPVTTADAYGQPVVTWTSIGVFWVGIEPLSGKERLEAGAERAETTVRIVMRYHASIDETYRVGHKGKYYDIQSVINPDLKNRYLHLMCREGLSDGR